MTHRFRSHVGLAMDKQRGDSGPFWLMAIDFLSAVSSLFLFRHLRPLSSAESHCGSLPDPGSCPHGCWTLACVSEEPMFDILRFFVVENMVARLDCCSTMLGVCCEKIVFDWVLPESCSAVLSCFNDLEDFMGEKIDINGWEPRCKTLYLSPGIQDTRG